MNKAGYEAKKTSKEIKESFEAMGSSAESLLRPFGEIGEKLGSALGGIGKTLSGVSSSMAGLTGSFGAAGAAAGLAAGAVAALGIAGAGIALSAAKAANEMFELSEKTGVSTESLSRFGYAAGLNGVSLEQLGKGIEKMNKSIFAAATAPAGAVNAFTRLGVSLKDAEGNLRSSEDILVDLAEKFKKLPEGPARGALAMQVFGKAGAEMIPFLIQGKSGIQALSAEADKLGITIGGKTAEGSHVFEQTLKRMQGALQGAANIVLKDMLPALQGFADFIFEDLKDPSGVFRSIGRTILDVVVPAFKILAGVVGTVIAAADTVVSVFSHGLDFIAQQVYSLANAFTSLKNGSSFKQAGQELKEGFKRGLEDFSKGVTEDTEKANQRLSSLYGKLIFGADDTDQSKKSHHGGDEGIADREDKSNPIKDRIAKLTEAARAEGALAGAVNLSASAIRVQNEQNEIAKVKLELLQLSAKTHIPITDAMTASVRRAVIAAQEFKAAFTLRDEIAKQTLALGLNVEKVNQLSAAYMKGGDAILDAEAKVQAAPLQQKVDELSASLEENRKNLGEDSDAYKRLASDLRTAQAELNNFIIVSKRFKEADAANQLAKGLDQLRASIAGLRVIGDAIGGSTEQMRQAAVQAKLLEYLMTHQGVKEGSKEWKQYAAAVEEASRQTDANKDKSEALKYNLQKVFTKSIEDLQKYRKILVESGADTIAIDAKIAEETRKMSKEYAQLLLRTDDAKNGVKAFFLEFTNDGKNAATGMFDAMKVAFDGIETQFAEMIVKGKANFKQLAQDIELTLAKASIHNLEKTAVKGLTNLFPGLGNIFGGGAKRDGSSAGSALYVQTVGDNGGLVGALPLGNLGGIANLLGNGKSSSGSGFLSGLSGIFSKIGGSIGGMFGKLFGGFRADGGSVDAGRAYVVGEKRPELFIPRMAGTIVKNVSSSDTKSVKIVNQLHVHGVTDADSFRKSQHQILTALSRGQGLAASRA
jgi:lambda family phage tail tape measure protein